VLRGLPLSPRLVGALEAESGLNDAPTVVLVTLISTGSVADHGIPITILVIVFELVAGVLVGLGVGFGGAWLMRRAALPSSGLYPLAVVALTLLAYGAASTAHASGFAAIYVGALVLGNSELPHRIATRSFAEGVAWLAQIGLFVMLGLLLTPSRITWSMVGVAVVGSLLLTFVARPITVWVSSVVQPMPWHEMAFVSWAGLRGAVPIVLATIPLAEGVTDAERLFDIVFVIVVISTVLTGPTLPRVARVLGVTRQLEPRSLDLEVAPLERVSADMLQVTVSPVSRLHGVEVGELRLPEGASVSMVVRDGHAIVPERRTVLRHGDDVLIVTPHGLREPTVRRLRTVSAHGRLGRWLGE
jgi:potassium/hydrogen antiporter